MPSGTMHPAAPQLRQSTSVGRTTAHQVACHLPEGLLRGTLEVLVNRTPGRWKLRVALVNVGRITGVAEWDNQPV